METCVCVNDETYKRLYYEESNLYLFIYFVTIYICFKYFVFDSKLVSFCLVDDGILIDSSFFSLITNLLSVLRPLQFFFSISILFY